jgi:S-DNA-T family DNA segregation ATPase FtsK/SpoIIIE
MTRSPHDVRFLLVDPKMVELTGFKELPHLLCPVVTDMKKAASILEWAESKMDERYEFLSMVNVRNIAGYNSLSEQDIRERYGLEPDEEIDPKHVPLHLPYIIIIIDELADLMLVAPKEIETSITRLAQKSRAVGIHIILATQRPSVDVITGLIKSNLPARISFRVASKVDSRTILDQNGADKLLGSGDMLFLQPGTSKLIRAQGTYVSDDEIHRVVEFAKAQQRPDFSKELVQMQEGGGEFEGSKDPLYEQAVRIVMENQRGSVSLLQRKLEIGYSRAARLIDFMAEEGLVGSYKGSQAREVLLTLEEWEERLASQGES